MCLRANFMRDSPLRHTISSTMPTSTSSIACVNVSQEGVSGSFRESRGERGIHGKRAPVSFTRTIPATPTTIPSVFRSVACQIHYDAGR